MDIGSRLTPQDSAIEVFDPDSDENVNAHTFEDLTVANDEAVCMPMTVRMILQESCYEIFLIASLSPVIPDSSHLT